MVINRDGSARTLGRTYGNVLVKGRHPFDGWLVDTSVLIDGVGRPIAGERAL